MKKLLLLLILLPVILHAQVYYVNSYNRCVQQNKTLIQEKPKGSIAQDSTINTSSITMIFFEKKGSEFDESFSLKNNTSSTVHEISIRMIYYLNNEPFDYRDLILQADIPSGLSRMFTVRSFDQQQHFESENAIGNYTGIYKKFTVKYQILNYN